MGSLAGGMASCPCGTTMKMVVGTFQAKVFSNFVNVDDDGVVIETRPPPTLGALPSRSNPKSNLLDPDDVFNIVTF